MMERSQCKLDLKTSASGRGLGGHLKVRLATVPPKTEPRHLGCRRRASTPSSSPFFSGDEDGSEGDEEVERHVGVEEEKALVYALRENPKKSFRLADPEFSFAVDGDGGAVVQDRESETESKNPTRRRTKRSRGKPGGLSEPEKIDRDRELEKPRTGKASFAESPSEPEPVSSVSHTSPEQDIAMCLMMLSRDSWNRNSEKQDRVEKEVQIVGKKRKGRTDEPKSKRHPRGKHQCEKCRKPFRSSGALHSHKRICLPEEAPAGYGDDRIFECPFCFQLFGSGQALGGHKRSHLIALSSHPAAPFPAPNRETSLDLNLPAPGEDDDFSVISES